MDPTTGKATSGMLIEEIPNSTAVLVLGIISIPMCCCYGVVGLGCGVVALMLSAQAHKVYYQDPLKYSRNSYSNLRAGRVCAIIGVIFSSFVLFMFMMYILIYVVFMGAAFSAFPWEELNY